MMSEEKPYWNANPKPPRREKRPRIPVGRVGIKKKHREPTGELELFKRLVQERGSVSQISGKVIYNISVSSMMHILAKGKNRYPKFILHEPNIVIVTPQEHDDFDNGSHEELRKIPEWKWVFDRREELLQEYKKLYG